MSSVLRLFVIFAFFSLALICVSGQDLGSSNKLFGGKKTVPPAKTVKKVAPKHKPSTAKAKPAPKKKPATAKNTKIVHPPDQKIAVAKPKNTTDGSSKTPKVDISPVKPRDIDIPVSAANSQLFEKLIEEGNIARDDRNYSNAETAYQRARAIKPKDPRAVYGLGNLYSDQQRWEEAETSYRTALQLDPKDAFVHIALSYVLTQPLSAPNLSDRYEEAETLARRAILLAPSNALAFDQLGAALELRGLIGAETENAYRRSIQLDSSFAPAYAHLGRLLRRRGLTKESADAYKRATDLSMDAATMILVAEVMQSEQRYVESEPLLRRAIDADPRNPSALILLGRALTTQGKFVDAEQILRRSLSVSPNGYMPNTLLASLYTRQGKFEQAENSLLLALRSVPMTEKRQLSQQFEAVGDGYVKAGKSVNAERCYHQAVYLDAENTGLAFKLARIHPS